MRIFITNEAQAGAKIVSNIDKGTENRQRDGEYVLIKTIII